MRLFISALVATTLAGCVPPAIENSRPIGFDAYLSGERGGYTPLPNDTNPRAPNLTRPAGSTGESQSTADKLRAKVPEYTFEGSRRAFSEKLTPCRKQAGITGQFRVEFLYIDGKTHRWLEPHDGVTSTQAHIANKCMAS